MEKVEALGSYSIPGILNTWRYRRRRRLLPRKDLDQSIQPSDATFYASVEQRTQKAFFFRENKWRIGFRVWTTFIHSISTDYFYVKWQNLVGLLKPFFHL